MKPLNLRWAGMFSGHPLSPTRRWMISAGATVASTYALDVIATTAGLLLVWSALFQEVDRDGALAFLAVSYVAWGAGLRINLAENWALLAATGTSTNVLSKAGFDLVRSRTHSQRAQRIAAAIGYVGTEFAKEAPYYIGAVGAAVFSDRVAANQVIVFLGGANLGAALYEYGLARLVRAFLARSRGAVSFEHDWQPRRYLAEYYRAVEADERQTIAFFVEAMTHVRCGEPVLLFGVGPTVHHVFLTAPKASEIHLTDYLPGNLAEVRRWLDADPGMHDWQPFVRYTLQCEGQTAPSQADVAAREAVTRRKTSRLMVADLRDPQPILTQYATVISAYCADSAMRDALCLRHAGQGCHVSAPGTRSNLLPYRAAIIRQEIPGVTASGHLRLAQLRKSSWCGNGVAAERAPPPKRQIRCSLTRERSARTLLIVH